MNRTRLCLYFLLLVPLLVYCRAVFTEYGFHDDYANMREAREEPGKIVKFTTSHGRPLYGAMLESSLSKVEELTSLQWLRLFTVFLLTLLGVGLWWQLFQSGWSEIEAAVIGLGVTLLPAAQIEASWAISWPHVLALLLSLAGFAAVEAELERGGLRRMVALVGGGLIYCLAALIYQSNAVFAIVPIVGVLLVRSGREPATDRRWALMHLSIMFAGLLTAYLLVKFLFLTGVFYQSPRMNLETNPLTKIGWFLTEPLPNALALFALRDDHGVGIWALGIAAVAVAGIIGLGYYHVVQVKGSTVKKKWYLCMLVAPLVAHAVSLVAAERAVGYRTLFALSGLALLLLIFALRSLLEADRIKLPVYYACLGALVLGGMITAYFNTNSLIAQPQNAEWEIVRAAVMRVDIKKSLRVYLIRPAPEDRTTARTFVDEFGSLSSDSDWVPQEMFKVALHERFPKKLPAGTSFTVTSGREVPGELAYDFVIDLRKVRQHRE